MYAIFIKYNHFVKWDNILCYWLCHYLFLNLFHIRSVPLHTYQDVMLKNVVNHSTFISLSSSFPTVLSKTQDFSSLLFPCPAFLFFPESYLYSYWNIPIEIYSYLYWKKFFFKATYNQGILRWNKRRAMMIGFPTACRYKYFRQKCKFIVSKED